MTAAHTPTPWGVFQQERYPHTVQVENADGYFVTIANTNLSPSLSDDVCAANAAHIVHCVNNFDALAAERDRMRDTLLAVIATLNQPVQNTGYADPSSKDAVALAIIRGDCAAAINKARRIVGKDSL